MVLHSLFEEQITLESEDLDRSLNQGTESFAESLNYLPDLEKYNLGPEPYLEHIAKVKKSVGIPILASLNGVSTGGWTRYAKMMEEAGADAIELNIYYMPTDTEMGGASVEDKYCEVVKAGKKPASCSPRHQAEPFLQFYSQCHAQNRPGRRRWSGPI